MIDDAQSCCSKLPGPELARVLCWGVSRCPVSCHGDSTHLGLLRVHNHKGRTRFHPASCTGVLQREQNTAADSAKVISSGQCWEWHGADPRPAHLPSHSLTGEVQPFSLPIKSHLSNSFCLKNRLQQVENSPQFMVSLDKQ